MAQISEPHREQNISNEITKKMLATQNVIRSKFRKAYAHRIEQEKKQAIRPVLAVSSTHLGPTTTIKTTDSPNELCERLRKLISTMREDDVKQIEEAKAIINKLREQGVLV